MKSKKKKKRNMKSRRNKVDKVVLFSPEGQLLDAFT